MNFTEIDKNIPTLGIKSSQRGNNPNSTVWLQNNRFR